MIGPGRAPWVAAFVVVIATLLSGCGSSSASDTASEPPATSEEATTTVAPSTTTTLKVYAPSAFDATDALLAERVRSAGLPGGMVRLARADGTIIHGRSIFSQTRHSC